MKRIESTASAIKEAIRDGHKVYLTSVCADYIYEVTDRKPNEYCIICKSIDSGKETNIAHHLEFYTAYAE